MSRDVFTPPAPAEEATSSVEQYRASAEYAADGIQKIEQYANGVTPESAAGRHAITQSNIEAGIAAAEQHANSVNGEVFDMRYFTTAEGHKHVATAMLDLNRMVLKARYAEQVED